MGENSRAEKQVCANQARADPQDPAWFGELARALDAEREDRCARITELHAEVAKQFSDVRTYMDTVVEAEETERKHEVEEVRGILESVWQRVQFRPAAGLDQAPNSSDKFSLEGAGSYKECGEIGDIQTLYDMVREALGDSVRLSTDLHEEREDRMATLTKLRLQMDNLRADVAALHAESSHSPQMR